MSESPTTTRTPSVREDIATLHVAINELDTRNTFEDDDSYRKSLHAALNRLIARIDAGT